MYPDSDAPITILDQLPASEDIQPGALVVVGHAHGLPDESVSELTRLAVRIEQRAHVARSQQSVGRNRRGVLLLPVRSQP